MRRLARPLRGVALVNLLLAIGDICFSIALDSANFAAIHISLQEGGGGGGYRDVILRVLTAIGILSKYGMNLLKPSQLRPAGWKIVYFVNAIFRDKVDSVKV